MIRIEIEGMSCGNCVKHVQKALAQVTGVEYAEVNLLPQEALVKGNVTPEALVAAIEAEGYTARLG